MAQRTTHLVTIAVTLAVLVNRAAADAWNNVVSCANPVFSNFLIPSSNVNDGLGDCTLDVKNVQPTDFPANHPMCTVYTGQKSCCTPGHLQQMVRAAKYQSAQIAAAKASWSENIENDQVGKLHSLNFELEDDAEFLSTCSTASGYTSASCALLTSQLNALTQAKNDLDAAAMTCLTALDNYASGMLCFACNTQWANNVGATTINLHTHTCSVLSAGCSNVNTNYIKMYKKYSDILQTIYTAEYPATTTLNPISTMVVNYPDLCGGSITKPGNCTNSICNQWVGGLAVAFPLGNFIPVSQTLRRALATRDISFVASELKPFVIARKLDTTFTNTYSITGYDPMCADGSPCGTTAAAVATGGLIVAPGVMIGTLVGVFVLVVIAAIVIVVLRRRLNLKTQQPERV